MPLSQGLNMPDVGMSTEFPFIISSITWTNAANLPSGNDGFPVPPGISTPGNVYQSATAYILGWDGSNVLDMGSKALVMPSSGSFANYTLGGPLDLWGNAPGVLDAAFINDVETGAGVTATFTGGTSQVLRGNDYDFTIPTLARISGVEMVVRGRRTYNSRSNVTLVDISRIELKIYYGYPHLHLF